jgi:hypothetical protein
VETELILEFWERLRGFDQWPLTEGKVRSSAVHRTTLRGKGGRLVDSWRTVLEVEWTDPDGLQRTRKIGLRAVSSDFNSIGSTNLSVRYKPTDYSKFFVREELRQKVLRQTMIWLAVLISLALILASKSR